jgi:hypothetical protein
MTRCPSKSTLLRDGCPMICRFCMSRKGIDVTILDMCKQNRCREDDKDELDPPPSSGKLICSLVRWRIQPKAETTTMKEPKSKRP